jgi:protocatechuate 3,4-dioxygenase beta subunit
MGPMAGISHRQLALTCIEAWMAPLAHGHGVSNAAGSTYRRGDTMDNDDEPVGRVLTRRDVVRLLTLGSAGVMVGCKRGPGAAETTVGAVGADSTAGAAIERVPECIVHPEMTVGPYFVDKQLERSDIRVEPTTGQARAGTPLLLAFNVADVRGGRCTPLAGAMVDVWQCDAAGHYSGVTDTGVGFDTVGQRFLRGYQITDANGVARFTTIYPGWYRGRTVHIHFKVRTPATAVLANASDGAYEFTSQLFFDDALTTRVFTQEPYASKGPRDMMNAQDGIYRQGGSQLVLAVSDASPGYAATFDMGLDLSDAETGKADRSGGPGGPGRRRPPAGRPPG